MFHRWSFMEQDIAHHPEKHLQPRSDYFRMWHNKCITQPLSLTWKTVCGTLSQWVKVAPFAAWPWPSTTAKIWGSARSPCHSSVDIHFTAFRLYKVPEFVSQKRPWFEKCALMRTWWALKSTPRVQCRNWENPLANAVPQIPLSLAGMHNALFLSRSLGNKFIPGDVLHFVWVSENSSIFQKNSN